MHSALLSGDPHDQLGIAYHLIVDNKRIEDETAKLDIKDFYVASSPPPSSNLIDSPARPLSATGNHSGRQRMLSGGNTPAERQRMLSGGNSLDKSKGTPIKRAKWHLGLTFI